MPRLTSNEREFLRIVLREDDGAALVDAYRALHCAGSEKSDQAVKVRITKLRGRPDATFFLQTEQSRRDAAALAKMREADEAVGEALLTEAVARQHAMERLTLAIEREHGRLEEDAKRPVSGMAKAVEVMVKLTAGGSHEDGMRDAEVEAMRREMERESPAGEAQPLARQLDTLLLYRVRLGPYAL